MGYLGNFIVYALAMVGVIAVALLTFKSSVNSAGGKSSRLLKVIDTMPLGQRKTLYVVSAGNEKFLIAGDVNNTTLISKLDLQNGGQFQHKEIISEENIPANNSHNTFKETIESLAKPSYMDKSIVGIKSSLINSKSDSSTVIRNIAEIMKK